MAYKGKKRIMRTLKINEISGVDFPAQEGARAVLLKRDGEQGEEVPVEKQLRLTTANKGHTHLFGGDFAMIDGGGHTSYELTEGAPFTHNHPFIMNSDGSITIGRAEGHGHSATAQKMWVGKKWFEEQAERLAKAAEDSADDSEGGGQINKEGSDMDPKEKQAAEELAKAEAKVVETQAELATAKALASMNDEVTAYHSKLDEPAQVAFLAKSATERTAEVEAAKAEDPVVYKDLEGHEYRKSEDVRLVAAIKRADVQTKKAQVANEAAEGAVLAKRAGDELARYPEAKGGAKVALLKAVDGIPDGDHRKAVGEMLKAGQGALAAAFLPLGVEDSPELVGKAAAEGQLETLAKAHQKTHTDLSYEAAYAAVVDTSEGQALYEQTMTTLQG